jgi:predicted RNase H-like HicB family nuclease
MTICRFKVLVEWDPEDHVWVTLVPSLDHLSTFGETREEALEQTREFWAIWRLRQRLVCLCHQTEQSLS